MEYSVKSKLSELSAAAEDEGMLYAYRIVAPRWVESAFSGEGAHKYGGRWNAPGRHVVYLGGSRALTALEMLVHLTTPSSRKKTYQLIRVGIPREDLAVYPSEILPAHWNAEPSMEPTQAIGNDWVDAAAQLALMVPSALIPEEYNLLLNPKHPRFSELMIEPPLDFRFDPRL
ncbi:RES family NAD+ phosphorylase [Rubritalea marina]|uniref:RES family NAD+ phosphorylase n=1 Tax=Rubritalea marina TaxID=361055 RepID=UPI000376037D|nr:RES family NAD+ phosphorylase [Rubritalea marina]